MVKKRMCLMLTQTYSPHYETSFIANGVTFYIRVDYKPHEMFVYHPFELDDIVIYMPLN